MHLVAEPFPPSPPSSLDDPRVVADHDWNAFQDLRLLTNHWNRPGWNTASRFYYWMLTFEHMPILAEVARQCQEPLSHLPFDPINSAGLHLTLARVGSVDTVDSDQMNTLLHELRSSPPAAFTLQAIPLAGSPSAVRLSVAPWSPILELHTRLRRAMLHVGLAAPKPTRLLRPHIGVGYINRSVLAGPVISAVAPLRDLPATRLRVEQVNLVELYRVGREYRWTPHAEVGLGAARAIDSRSDLGSRG